MANYTYNMANYTYNLKFFTEGYRLYISKAKIIEGATKVMETCTVSVYVPPDSASHRKFDLEVTTSYDIVQASIFFRELGLPDNSDIASLAYGGKRIIRLQDYMPSNGEKAKKRSSKSTALAQRIPKTLNEFLGSGLIERMEKTPEEKWIMLVGPSDSEWQGAWIQYIDAMDESVGLRQKTIMYEDVRIDTTRFRKVLQATSVPLSETEMRKLEDMVKVALLVN